MKTMTIDEEISITLKAILTLEEKGDIGAIMLAEKDLAYLREKKCS